ncbi:ABC transporter ATP-binding protein [Patescibacteria group bacterium]|nr:ABC transporter ATP-binding protein [Patescibacteria group bacterium]
MALIEAKHIYKSYFTDSVETEVLKDMSFSIEEGEFVAIMGPSGSGKSTLLHILGFLDDQTKGSYYFNKKQVKDYTGSELAHIRNKEMGFVFQSFNLLPRTSVYDNVELPLIYSDFPKGEWDDMILNSIGIVGLEKRMDNLSSQLSGGEQQRVAIARALVNNPRVIFADEPTGNLDSKSGQNIMETLQELNQKDGHTIILITHETYIAEHAQRIIRIMDGKIKSDKKVRKRRDANHGFSK